MAQDRRSEAEARSPDALSEHLADLLGEDAEELHRQAAALDIEDPADADSEALDPDDAADE